MLSLPEAIAEVEDGTQRDVDYSLYRHVETDTPGARRVEPH